jgi:hypothetical protein
MPSSPESTWHRYHRATRSATYGLLATLPLLVAYEAMMAAGTRLADAPPVRLGAAVWMKQGLAALGLVGPVATAAVVAVAAAGVYWADRHRPIPLRGSYFAGVVGESAVYAVAVAGLVSGLVGAVFAAAPPPEGGLWTQLALSIGAGLYEELLFRVVLVGGLAGLFRLALPRGRAYLLAAVLGAALFSLVHYVGALGDPFALPSFTFRFAFGLALNALFLLRGFAVAAWTHALYDVLLVVGLLG